MGAAVPGGYSAGGYAAFLLSERKEQRNQQATGEADGKSLKDPNGKIKGKTNGELKEKPTEN